MIHFRSAAVTLFTVTGETSYSERKLCDGKTVRVHRLATEITTPRTYEVNCPACVALIKVAQRKLKEAVRD